MRKWIALLLAAALALSLCACGGGSAAPTVDDAVPEVSEPEPEEALLSKEEMLAGAVEIDDYAAEMAENKLRAEAKYIGNVYLVTGLVSNIESDHVDVGEFTVSLPTEDILQLSSGQKITVVGRIESLSAEDSSQMMDGFSYTQTNYHGVLSNGYFVTDTFVLSGTLIFYYMDLLDIDGKTHHNYGDEHYWSFGLDMTEDNIIAVGYSMAEDIPFEHVMGQDIDSVTISGQELKTKEKITVSAKVFYTADQGYVLKDVELISVDS